MPLEEALTITDVPHTVESQDSIQLLSCIYKIPALFPVIVENDFPITLNEEAYRQIVTAANVVSVPSNIQQHIFNAYHAASIVENINFNNKQGKRRKK